MADAAQPGSAAVQAHRAGMAVARETFALSVHGSVGALDLWVPSGATIRDVAVEYAAQARVTTPFVLYTRFGRRLEPGQTLLEAGLDTGGLLVAVDGAGSAPGGRSRRRSDRMGSAKPGQLSALWFSVAATLALFSGWYAAMSPDGTSRDVTIGLLIAVAVLGVLPIGSYAPHRVLAAPAFAFAAAFALAWEPPPEMLPTILGASALAAAVIAALARALQQDSEEALRVWMVVGAAVFVVTAGGVLIGASTSVVWSVLLVVAMLAARFVPMIAVDVPDQYLIDLERLAVTAWSARERPTGKRGRTIVPHQAVAQVATDAARMVTAACVAILVTVTISAPALLASTEPYLFDRIGARCLVGFAGLALLFAARSYRHAAARALLRASGLVCVLATVVVIFGLTDAGGEQLIAILAIGIAVLLILVSVALGRGWRSAWWSRRAEVGEGFVGAFAVAAVVVATGLFRQLWELTS